MICFLNWNPFLKKVDKWFRSIESEQPEEKTSENCESIR